MGTRQKQRKRHAIPEALVVTLRGRVTLETQTSGKIVARFDGFSVDLGKFSASAAKRAQRLREGLPLCSFLSHRRTINREIDRLVRRLARHGLLEYRFRSQSGDAQVIIEPQMADYWPHIGQLCDDDNLVLSRFAYMRRRADEVVLESPRAGAYSGFASRKS